MQSIATVQTNPMLAGDIVQFRQPAYSSAGGRGCGSVSVFKTPDSNTDRITVFDIPSLLHSQEEAVDFSRKDARGSKEQSGILGRVRGSSTLSSVSTCSFTGGGISGPSTKSGGAVGASSSPVGSVHGLVNPSRRVVEYPSHGVAGPPTVGRSVVDSAGLAGDPVSSRVITSLCAISGSVESLSASIGSVSPGGSTESVGPSDLTEGAGPCRPTESAGPCGPTESAGPCGPTESAKAPLTRASAATNFTRSVIAPSGATGDTPPRHPHNVTDEKSGLNKRSVSKHKSKSAREAKSAVVYLEHVELSLCKENLEGCDPSFLSAAFPPIHRTPSVSSDRALPSETPHKTTPRPKKKSKRTSDSGKNKSGHSNKKGKAHSSHNSMGKQAGEYGKAEKSRGASDATKAIQRDRKERETKRIEAMSNAVQYNIVSSDDDDLPIAYLIKSGAYRDLSSKYTKQDAGPATDKQSPHSTPLETLSNKESLEKDKRSGSSAKVSDDKSSSTGSSIPPSKISISIARNAKSPKKSDCDKTQKRSSSGRSILLSPEESLNAHKRSKTKPSSKTKKTDQTIVSKQPVPSLLSRARKVREVSTYSEGLSYGTLLSMPSSLENLLQSRNEGEKETAPCNDDPIQIDSETERLETNTCVESGDGDDDVVIASALLSLSNSVPGNSGFTNIRQNGKSTETASSCFEDAGQSNRTSSDAGFEICRDPFPHYKTACYNGESGLTNSDPEILYEKDTPGSSQAEITCSYDSGCVDLTTATRDFDLDGCSMKDLRTSSFSSPSIGLVVNIDEGSVRTPSSPSTSTSACPSVPESHVDEFPGSWPSEEISKMSGKRRRSPSADSDQKTRVRKATLSSVQMIMA